METAVRNLTRSVRNRVFAGVCGGLAEYLGWDAVMIRVAYVALTLLSFGVVGVLLYLAAWLVIPLEAASHIELNAEHSSRSSARGAIGVLLVIVGALALLDSFMPWFWHIFSLHLIASVVLIGLGLIVIFWKKEEPQVEPTGLAPEATPPDAPRSESERRLMRLQRGRKIAGVCSGLGKHFSVDPTVIRLVFLALVLAGGSGILLYLVLWIVMPLDVS